MPEDHENRARGVFMTHAVLFSGNGSVVVESAR
jgi:hypothetical protein